MAPFAIYMDILELKMILDPILHMDIFLNLHTIQCALAFPYLECCAGQARAIAEDDSLHLQDHYE